MFYQAKAAVNSMQKSRRAAAEEREFWVTLVQARESREISIPTVAEMSSRQSAVNDQKLANPDNDQQETNIASRKFEPGTRVEVFWPMDDEWYPGVVGDIDAEHNKQSITYDDGEFAWLDLAVEDIRLAGSSKGSEAQKNKNHEEKSCQSQPNAESTTEPKWSAEKSPSNQSTTAPSDATTSRGGDMLAVHLSLHAAHTKTTTAVDEGVGGDSFHATPQTRKFTSVAEHRGPAGSASSPSQQPQSQQNTALSTPASVDGPATATHDGTPIEDQPSPPKRLKISPTSVTAGPTDSTPKTPPANGSSPLKSSDVTGGRNKRKAAEMAQKLAVDVATLNAKYKADMSAAAALMATIAAYADTTDDQVVQQKAAQQAQEDAALEAEFGEDFGDLDDLDDEAL